MEPQARRDRLITQSVGDELVVYDEERHVAHRLNLPAAAVWRLADGHRTVSDLAALLQEELGGSVDEGLVYVALDELQTANLLSSGVPPEMERVSRRQMIATLATLLPVVASIKLDARAGMAACTYAAAPTNFPSVMSTGASLVVFVTPNNAFSCLGIGWTASGAGFVTVSPTQGGGISETVTLTVPANTTSSPRTATVTIAGTPVTVTQNPAAQPCSQTQVSGGDTPVTRTVNLGKTPGTVVFTWDMQTQKDQMSVRYQGTEIFNTGCVSGSGTMSIPYAGQSTEMTVVVTPNCEFPNATGTVWSFTLSCP